MTKLLSGRSVARRQVLAIALAVVMALSLGFVLNAGGGVNQAYAASTDPNMMSYDFSNDTGVYTYILDNSDTAAVILFGPAQATSDGDLYPTYFSNQAQAEGYANSFSNEDPDYVEFIYGDDLVGATVQEAFAVEVEDAGTWGIVATILLPNDGSFGSLSVKVKNPFAASVVSNYTNIAIVRNEAVPPTYTTAIGVDVRIYDPLSTSGAIVYSSGALDVQSNVYYENPSSRSFPTAMDAIMNTYYEQAIDELTHVGFDFGQGLGDYIDSMTFTTSPDPWEYEDLGGGTYNGWAYAVYRNSGPGYDRVDIGKWEYPGSYKMKDGDLIVWKYGKLTSLYYDAYYDALFPNRL